MKKGILIEYNTKKNFWELNTQFKTCGEFKTLYDEDKSKKKANSSRIMWAVALLVDPHDSMYKHISEEEKRGIIETDFLKDSDFEWNKYENVVSEYEKFSLSKLQRSGRGYQLKLEEREKFLLSTPYTLDNAKDLDMILANSKKLIDLIEDINAKIEKEEGEGQTKGGREESITEKGII